MLYRQNPIVVVVRRVYNQKTTLFPLLTKDEKRKKKRSYEYQNEYNKANIGLKEDLKGKKNGGGWADEVDGCFVLGGDWLSGGMMMKLKKIEK